MIFQNIIELTWDSPFFRSSYICTQSVHFIHESLKTKAVQKVTFITLYDARYKKQEHGGDSIYQLFSTRIALILRDTRNLWDKDDLYRSSLVLLKYYTNRGFHETRASSHWNAIDAIPARRICIDLLRIFAVRDKLVNLSTALNRTLLSRALLFGKP